MVVQPVRGGCHRLEVLIANPSIDRFAVTNRSDAIRVMPTASLTEIGLVHAETLADTGTAVDASGRPCSAATTSSHRVQGHGVDVRCEPPLGMHRGWCRHRPCEPLDVTDLAPVDHGAHATRGRVRRVR